MEMIDFEEDDMKVCPEDLMSEKDIMEGHTVVVEEDVSLGSVDVDEHSVDLPHAEALLDTGTDDEDSPYQFRSNDGVTYQVVQVNGTNISPDTNSTLPHIITTTSTLPSSQSTLQTVFTGPLSGQVYVLGPPDDVYTRTVHKPIAPRLNNITESSRSPVGSKRDDRKRATHNAVERRRRDKINMWIMKLSKIVPDCNSDSKNSDVQQSKGGILAKAYDHITELAEANQKLSNVLDENEMLKQELSKQKSQNNVIKKEISLMKDFLEEKGLSAGYREYSSILDNHSLS